MEELILKFGGVAGAILALVGVAVWISKVIRIELKPVKDMKDTTKALIQYSITRAYEDYRHQGYISTIAKRCLQDLYKQYKEAGGNHFIDTLMKEIDSLPMASETIQSLGRDKA